MCECMKSVLADGRQSARGTTCRHRVRCMMTVEMRAEVALRVSPVGRTDMKSRRGC